MLELLVMRSMTAKSMTHSEDEEETSHLCGLPDSAIAVIGVNGDFNDSWYKWNLANSSAVN